MDKNIRIAIIGGGPAGVSAAMYLEKKGYNNYVVYEKSDHVGGKCHSPHYNGKRYEMGAIMGCPSYKAVFDCEEFGGATHEAGPKLVSEFIKPDGRPDPTWDTKSAVNHPLKYFLAHPKSALRMKKMKKQVERLGELLRTKYKGYDVNGHRGVSEGRYEGWQSTDVSRQHIEGVNPNLKDLALPFDQFCELNGVPLVKHVWILPFIPFGYGYFDEIPAGYVLKYLDFSTMMNFMHGNLCTWAEGTQSIYEGVNNHLKHPAELNSEITSIDRSGEKVKITVNGRVEEFDKLIVTAPLQFLPEYCDCDEEEKALFSRIDYERYDSMAFLTKPECYPKCSGYIVDNMTKETMGNVMIYYNRWKTPDQPLSTYVLRKRKEPGESVEAYKARAEIDYKKNKEHAKKDCEKLGLPVVKEINEGAWYYFPHVFSEDYANGWYEKMEAKQGSHNTYYAGEIMSFGDMDETVEYSRDLVERFFAD